MAYSLTTGRSHFALRLALTAATLEQAQEKLAGWIRKEDLAGTYSGTIAENGKPEVAFLFTGQGAQYPNMARHLFETQPAFRKNLEQCDEILRPHLEKPLLSVIYPTDKSDEHLIDQTAYTQPALFAIEYSLAKLWQSWGVEPAVVMGHSIGEYVAACIAGVFSLEDGLKLIAAHGRLMQALPTGGTMVSMYSDEKRVRAAIAPYESVVSIAAINGPRAVVVSGAESTVGLVVEALHKDGIKSQRLNVSHAFHSPLMDPIMDELEQVAQSIQYHSPQIGVVSNVNGRLITDDSISNASYWRKHARQTVRFSEGIKVLHEEGYHFFLEIGPTPTLLGLARRCEPVSTADVWLPSLRAGRNDWEQMLESLAQLYVNGLDVDWEAFENVYKAQRRRVELPTYPFQREHYWLDFEPANNGFETKTDHPLLGARLSMAMPVFQKQLNAQRPPYLKDHRIHDIVILPAAAYIEIALAAAKNGLDGGPYTLEDISIHEALPLSDTADCITQIILTPNASGASLQFFSRTDETEQNTWRLHANGSIRYQISEDASKTIDLKALQARLSQPMSVEAYYEHLSSVGADYGPHSAASRKSGEQMERRLER